MIFPSQNTPKSMSAGALPQTPLGELQRFPDALASFKGAILWQEGREVKDYGRGRGEGRSKREWGREEKRGKLGGG